MTQEEFNAMLQVAIAQGLPGGYYTSKFSGEEQDALLSGKGMVFLGQYATVDDVPDPVDGGHYYIGSEPPYHVYTYISGVWVDAGTMQGPKGDKGDPFIYEDFTPEQLDDLERGAKAAQSAAENAADRAEVAQSAAQQSATSAAESAAVYDDVVADVNQLKQDFIAVEDAKQFKPYLEKFISRTGKVTDYSGWDCTDLINAKAGDRFIYKGYTTSASYPCACLYDTDGVFVEIIREGNAGYDLAEYICDKDCKLRFCSWRVNGNPLVLYGVSTSIENLYFYDKPLKDVIMDGMIADKYTNIDLPFESKTGYIDNNKTFSTYSNIWGATVDVDPTKIYVLNYRSYYAMSETVFYDSNNNIISAITTHQDDADYQIEFQPPQNATKVMIQAYGVAEATIRERTSLKVVDERLLNGEKIDAYTIPYKFSTVGDVLDGVIGGRVSPLLGKKIAYDGDSICESRFSGTTANGGAYAYMISQLTGGTYDNQAVGGGILAAAVPSGSMPHSVVLNLSNLPSDADLYCFEGGLNDFWRDVPLGDYTEDDYISAVDTTTVCGALEHIFRAVTYYHTDVPVCFVFTHRPTGTKTANNASTPYTFQQMREKMIGICEKYAIPFYDAYSESGLNGYNDPQNAMYLTAGQSQPYDGIHPNARAYERFYVPQLIALFESLMPIDY